MTPTIIAKGIDASQALRDYIRDSVDSALNWTQDSIHFVTVRITDLNGPKGGKDKRCQIHLKLPGLPNVVVSEVSSSINSAIDRAVLRTSRVVSRVLERAKEIQPINVPVLRRVAI
ncbi:MAG: Sigma 54 modulation protein / ribosomal protein [Burkholderiaceae bacterium]|nr:Sigma 54 modulation protein / ribosomal protein [Burkholderiaceae bacterium]